MKFILNKNIYQGFKKKTAEKSAVFFCYSFLSKKIKIYMYISALWISHNLN